MKKKIYIGILAVLYNLFLISCINNQKELVQSVTPTEKTQISLTMETLIPTKTPEPNIFEKANIYFLNKKIALLKEENKISILDINTKELNMVTHTGGDIDILVSWSPDGKWLLYLENQELSLMKSDGSQLRQIQSNFQTRVDISWSPDSSYFLLSIPGSDCEIYDLKNDSLEQFIPETRFCFFLPSGSIYFLLPNNLGYYTFDNISKLDDLEERENIKKIQVVGFSEQELINECEANSAVVPDISGGWEFFITDYHCWTTDEPHYLIKYEETSNLKLSRSIIAEIDGVIEQFQSSSNGRYVLFEKWHEKGENNYGVVDTESGKLVWFIGEYPQWVGNLNLILDYVQIDASSDSWSFIYIDPASGERQIPLWAEFLVLEEAHHDFKIQP